MEGRGGHAGAVFPGFAGRGAAGVLDLQGDVGEVGGVAVLPRGGGIVLFSKGEMEAIGGENGSILKEKESGYGTQDHQCQCQKHDAETGASAPASAAVPVIVAHSRSPFKETGGAYWAGWAAGAAGAAGSALGASRLTISLRGQTVAQVPQPVHLL